MARTVRVAIALLFLITGMAVPYFYYEHQQAAFRNFRVVRPGYLYRSGQLTPSGLRRLVHEYGFRTVITLRERDDADEKTADQSRWEEEYCNQNSIAYVRIPARRWWIKDGPAPARKSVAKFLDVLRDPEHYPPPILLHCFAGEHRTGAYCAIYRMEFDGWSNIEAMAEMKRCGYVNLDKEWDVRSFIRLYQPVTPHAEVTAREAAPGAR
jgi:tyrosine-protein phosphatase SIW14